MKICHILMLKGIVILTITVIAIVSCSNSNPLLNTSWTGRNALFLKESVTLSFGETDFNAIMYDEYGRKYRTDLGTYKVLGNKITITYSTGNFFIIKENLMNLN